jgi:hypothetical protein
MGLYPEVTIQPVVATFAWAQERKSPLPDVLGLSSYFRNELLAAEDARRLYGAVVDPVSRTVDQAATAVLRQELASRRS